MEALTEPTIRASFLNCTKGEASRLHVPADLDQVAWEALDFFGWVDPRAPLRAYLVTRLDGDLRGVQLRRNTSGAGRARMCSLCATTHPGSGVSLMVAPRAGQSGRNGNTVGLDICADLACSLYARGLRKPAGATVYETLSVEERIARVERNLAVFVARVGGRGQR